MSARSATRPASVPSTTLPPAEICEPARKRRRPRRSAAAHRALRQRRARAPRARSSVKGGAWTMRPVAGRQAPRALRRSRVRSTARASAGRCQRSRSASGSDLQAGLEERRGETLLAQAPVRRKPRLGRAEAPKRDDAALRRRPRACARAPRHAPPPRSGGAARASSRIAAQRRARSASTRSSRACVRDSSVIAAPRSPAVRAGARRDPATRPRRADPARPA